MSNEIPDFDRIDAAAAQISAGSNVVPITTEPEAENQEPEISSSELLKPILTIGFQVVAPNWKITPEEINQLSDAYGALVDKYLPDTGLEKFGTEISAVMVTAMVMLPRASIPRKPVPTKKTEKSGNKEIKMGPLKDAS